MRSRAPLALMEQMVMVLVFSLAAAVCLRAFVLADQTSRRSAVRDRAVVAVQNTAELLKQTRGAYRPPAGKDWSVTVCPVDSGSELLGAADVVAADEAGELFRLRVEWQEGRDA